MEVQAHVCGVGSVDVVTALLPLIVSDRRFATAEHTVWAFRATSQGSGHKEVEGKSCHAVGSKLLDMIRKKSEYESAILFATVRKLGMYPTLASCQTVVADVPSPIIPFVLV